MCLHVDPWIGREAASICLTSRPNACRESFGQGDVIGCFLDLSKGVVGFSKNGKYLGDAFQLDSAAAAGALFPAVVLKQARVRQKFSWKH